ncbi:MAG: hypothetical protein ABIB61_02475 [Candidatus Shapirobacteria bacterium]
MTSIETREFPNDRVGRPPDEKEQARKNFDPHFPRKEPRSEVGPTDKKNVFKEELLDEGFASFLRVFGIKI